MSDRKGQAIGLWARLFGGEKLIRVSSSDPSADQKALNKAFTSLGKPVRVSKDPDGNALWIKRKPRR